MIRSTLFCLFWFVVIWVGMITIGGGIAGSTAARSAARPRPTFDQRTSRGDYPEIVAFEIFHWRYGPWILAGAAALAVAGTATKFLPGTRP